MTPRVHSRPPGWRRLIREIINTTYPALDGDSKRSDHGRASRSFVAECLAGALERREPWGVWGGELFVSGVVVARKRPRGRPRIPVAKRTAGR